MRSPGPCSSSRARNILIRPFGPVNTDPYPQRLPGELLGAVISNDWVNEEYKHLNLKVHEHALKAYARQMFHLLCPSPDGAELWMHRPMSV